MNSKTVALLLGFLAIYSSVVSQTASCGDHLIESLQRQNTKGYDSLIHNMNLSIKRYVDQHSESNQGRPSGPLASSGFTIPVVFHIIHPGGQAYGTGSNISYQQILSQLDALNAAFSKSYPSYNGQSHAPYAQNTDIKFCLASIAMPSSVAFYNGPGGIENGVMRYADNTLTNHQMTLSDANSLVNLTHPTSAHFPFNNYVNIWVVSSIAGSSPGTVMGYAPRPLMGAYPLDGIVMRSDVIGDNSTGNTFSLGFALTQGKVLTHEMGHYLNLMHIFEGGCAGANAAGSGSDPCDLNGDMICDIEPCTTQNINCNAPTPNTCVASYSTGTTAYDMIEDYMSYADDDCMNTFTQGQKLRMHATLNTIRNNLWQFSNLTATGVVGVNGCAGSVLYIDIKKPLGNYCVNAPIVLSNATAGNTATSWNWTFHGGSPTAATTNSISVTYTAPGLYYAKLQVSSSTQSLTDSIPIPVSNCSLDPKKRDRSNWLFGDSCSISFASGSPSVNNLVRQKQTIKCLEVAVSMSDSLGNLLFYSNGVDLWDDTHTKINTSPIFGWDILSLYPSSSYKGSSVFGFIAFPMPGQPNKYAIVCIPPNETRTGAQINFSKISSVSYDVVTKTISPFQSLTSPLVNGANNTYLTEDLCVVPHCNGVDYWIIARSYINVSTGGDGVFYSFLFNQNGLNPSASPVVSGPFHRPAGAGGIKSNSVGNKLICNSGDGNYLLYNFNQTTGSVSNELLVPVTLPIQVPSCIAAIFSPNDNYLFLKYKGTSDNFIQQVSVSTMSVVNTLISPDMNYSPHDFGYMEIGPDNNIYYNARNTAYLGQIVNPDSPTPAIGSPVGFNPFSPYYNPGLSLVNYMEANKPGEVYPVSIQNTSCSSFSYSLSPCWNIYTSSWNFGDGTPLVNGHNVTHSYVNPGVYTVSLTLSYNGQSIPVYTKTLSVMSTTASIAGPSAICKGNTYINNYSTMNVSGATYNWFVNNASISGPANLSSVNVMSGSTGIATLSLQIISGTCISNGSKTIAIDTIPTVSLTSPTLTCLGNTVVLNGTPGGGTYTGVNVMAATYTPTNTGVQNVYYTYTNSNNCSGTASLAITVNACTGIEDNFIDNLFTVYPNPTSNLITICSTIPFTKIEVLNTIGQVVLVKQQIHTTNDSIALSILAKGIYYLRLSTDSGTVTKKIIRE